MTAQHWLGGYNVPPYLEVLPPPQLAPRVEWNHAPAAAADPAAATAAPAAATTPAATPSASGTPSPQQEQTEEAPLSRSQAGSNGCDQPNGGSGGGAAAAAATAVEASAVPAATTAAAPLVTEVDQPSTSPSSSPADASVPGAGPPPATAEVSEGQVEAGEETVPAAAPALGTAATSTSSGTAWRGGAPKIKVGGLRW